MQCIDRSTGSRWTALATLATAAMISMTAACTDTLGTAPSAPSASRGAASSGTGYQVTDLGTLGGQLSIALGMDNAGDVGGWLVTAEGLSHAFLWSHGTMMEIGSPGLNALGAGPNNRGQLAVNAEPSAAPDPSGEDLCGFLTYRVCRAAVWSRGSLEFLPTLGGPNSQAININDRGQVVGTADTTVTDPTCAVTTPSQVYRYEPVLWGPRGEIQALPTLPGDDVGLAFGLNEHDQVVGTTGNCDNTYASGFLLLGGPHAVLWDRGTAIPLDPPGRTNTISTAYSINDRGEVVGTSGAGAVHAFRWTQRTGMQDLGVLEGDIASMATSINARGQIVGTSCANTALCVLGPTAITRAVLWEDGTMRDLNDLTVDSPLFLATAFAINDAGQIAGVGVDLASGAPHAFVATPVSRDGSEARVRIATPPGAGVRNVRMPVASRFGFRGR